MAAVLILILITYFAQNTAVIINNSVMNVGQWDRMAV